MRNIGYTRSESYQREKDWLEYGCNVFHERKDNQSRPLSFMAYIEQYNVRIPRLYDMGYTRNDCMYCGFGINQEDPDCNRYQMLKRTHPYQYEYLIRNFGDLLQKFDIEIGTDDTK